MAGNGGNERFSNPRGELHDWGYHYIRRAGFCRMISGLNLCSPNVFSDVRMCKCIDAAPDMSLPVLLSIDKKLHILSRPPVDGPVEEVTKADESSPPPGTKFTPQDQGGNNNILAYVSVLAAVVLGLLLYVAYKWWVFARDASESLNGCNNDYNICPGMKNSSAWAA